MKLRLFVVTILLVTVASLSTFAQKQDNSFTTKSKEIKATENSLIQGRFWNNNLSVQNLKHNKSTLGYVFQDFEGTTFPPTGWSLVQLSGTASYWLRVATCSGFGSGTAAAKYNFYSSNNGISEAVVSPTFTASVAGDLLTFDVAHAAYSTEDDQLWVEVSSDGGTTWAALDTLHGNVVGDFSTVPAQTASFVPTASQWATKTYSLPVGTTQIRLKAVSGFGNNGYVDNIKIGTPPANDVGTYSVDFPLNSLPATITPKVTFKNFGSAAQTFPVTLKIGSYTSTKTVTALAPNTTVQVTFDNWNATVGTYALKAYSQLSGDANTANDTISTTVNVSTSTWLTGATFDFANYMGDGAGYVKNDTAYAFAIAGNTTPAGNNLLSRYNAISNTWTSLAPIPVARIVFGSAVAQNKLFVFGGAGTGDYCDSIYVYDIAANSWSLNALHLPVARGWARAATYQDSLIYVVGGLTSSSGSADGLVFLYNVNNNTIRTCTTMPSLVFGGGLAIYNNKIVSIGGATASALSAETIVGEISQLDRSIITWTSKTAFPGGVRFKQGAGSWGSLGVVVSGGNDGVAGGGYWGPLADHYQYNPDSDTWTALQNMPVADLGFCGSATRIGNKLRWVVAGGYNGTAPANTTFIYTADDPTPVELSSFTSNVVNNEVQLRWSTATETNNKGFSVERKSNGNWETIGFISGKGTTTEISNYTFTDKVNGSKYSYRLKQVDFDGTFEYSPVINVDLTGPKVYLLSQNYPNPFNPSTIIKFGLATDSKVSVKVFDILGREVATLINGSLEAGSHEVQFNAKNITSGVYFYKIEANGVDGSKFSATKKMMLTK
jgi:N-acetylneuraminic acid mutarotase